MDDRRQNFERSVFQLLIDGLPRPGESDETWRHRAGQAADRALANADLRQAVDRLGEQFLLSDTLPLICSETRTRLVEAIGLDGLVPTRDELPESVAAHLETCADCQRFTAELDLSSTSDVEIDAEILAALGSADIAPAPTPIRSAITGIGRAFRGVGARPQLLAASGEQDAWSVSLEVTRQTPAPDAPDATVDLRLAQVYDEPVTLVLRPVGWPGSVAEYHFSLQVEPTGLPAEDLEQLGVEPWVRSGEPYVVRFAAVLLAGDVVVADPGRSLRKSEQEQLVALLHGVVIEQRA